MKRVYLSIFLIVFILPVCGFPQTSAKTCVKNICVSSTSKKRTAGSYYDWTLTVQAQAPVLQSSIDSVAYYLHKTFNPRVITLKKIKNPQYKFDLHRSGWGEFNILVKVYLHNSRIPVTINHYLKL